MKQRCGWFALAVCLVWAGCSSLPTYESSPQSTVEINAGDEKIGPFQHRITWLFMVNGVYLKSPVTSKVRVNPGINTIGVFLADTNGRMTANFDFEFTANRRYRVVGHRNPAKINLSAFNPSAFGDRLGLSLAENQDNYDYRLELVDLTDGVDVVVKSIPVIVTKNFIPFRDGE